MSVASVAPVARGYIARRLYVAPQSVAPQSVAPSVCSARRYRCHRHVDPTDTGISTLWSPLIGVTTHGVRIWWHARSYQLDVGCKTGFLQLTPSCMTACMMGFIRHHVSRDPSVMYPHTSPLHHTLVPAPLTSDLAPAPQTTSRCKNNWGRRCSSGAEFSERDRERKEERKSGR